MSLTISQINKLAPKDRLYRKLDGRGLYLEVAVSGSKIWVHRFKYRGSSTMHTLGHFPEMSPAKAREKLYEDKNLLNEGINPNSITKNKGHEPKSKASKFLIVFDDWHKHTGKVKDWSEAYSQDIKERMLNYVIPEIGSRRIDQINTRDMMKIFKKMENKGVLDTLHKVKGYCFNVFNHAIVNGAIENNPISPITSSYFRKKKQKNFAHITDPREFAEILKKIYTHESRVKNDFIQMALIILPHVFLRSIELCGLRWKEVDMNERLIRIDPSRVKVRIEHLVPMSQQVHSFFEDIHDITGDKEFVFQTPFTGLNQPISTNALLKRLRLSGADKNDMTLHGFRHTASTMLNEMGFDGDIVEKQLSHTDRNQVRSTYNKAVRLKERREMMQRWSDRIDELVNLVNYKI